MPALDVLPVRDERSGFVVPPARMAPWRSRRPLKRWRYVGLYGEGLMLCAARARVAGIPQAFFAVWDRRTLREATSTRPRCVALDGVVRFAGADLRWEPDGDAIEVTSRHGESYIWTRKMPVIARGHVDGHSVTLRGVIDDSAGYHARETAWRWCAGVGIGADGEHLAWNLVEGVHDAPQASERTVWVDGAARELPAGTFDDHLTAVRWAGGEELRFAEETRRARHEDRRIFASDYIQPFGTFAGALPGGVAVTRGWGVMERHDVRW